MRTMQADGWLAADTLIHADGRDVEIGRFVDEHLGVPTGRVEHAPSRATLLTFCPADGRTVGQPITAVHRHPAPDRMSRIRLGNGVTLAVSPGARLFTFTLAAGAISATRAVELAAGALCLTPRLTPPPAVAGPAFADPAARVLGRPLARAEVAARRTCGPIRLPLAADETFGWLVGVLLVIPPGQTARFSAELRRLVSEVHQAVFGVGLLWSRDGWYDTAHPAVRRYLGELGLLGPDLPPWLKDVSEAELTVVLAGLVDAAGAIRPTHRQVVLRLPPQRGTAMRRVLHRHGLIAEETSGAGNRYELTLTHRDARLVAGRLRLRRPELEARRRALLARDPGRGLTLGPQPELVASLLDDLDRGRWGDRLRGARILAAALGISERTFYDLLAGDRALHWDELRRLQHLAPSVDGPTVNRLRALAVDELHPVPVTAVERCEPAGPAYAVTVADSRCAGLLADGIAVGDLRLAG